MSEIRAALACETGPEEVSLIPDLTVRIAGLN
jgi:hypothetical protein